MTTLTANTTTANLIRLTTVAREMKAAGNHEGAEMILKAIHKALGYTA